MHVTTTLALISALMLAPYSVARADEESQDPPIQPQRLSAGELLTACASSGLTTSGRLRRRYCDGYVSGVEEALRLSFHSLGVERQFCTPIEVTSRELSEAFRRYAAGRRPLMHRPSAVVVLEALQEAYPCADRDAGQRP